VSVNYAKSMATIKRPRAAPKKLTPKVTAVIIDPVDCTVTIQGSQALIEGKYPLKVLQKATSFYVPGYAFAPAFRSKRWDGKKHLFSVKTQTFPSGLVAIVREAIKEAAEESKTSFAFKVVDNRELNVPNVGSNGFELEGITFGQGIYDYQLEAAKAMVEARRGILKVATNGGKTEIACAVTKHLSVPTLFLVGRLELLHQTRKRFAKRLNIDIDEIGIIGDSEFKIGNWITVATPSSLKTKIEKDLVPLDKWNLVLSDECHHAASDTHYDVLDQLPAYYRFGLSGTPLDRGDGADLKLIAQTGPVLYDVPNKLLVERGISVPPHVDIIKIDKPILPAKGMTWNQVNQKGVVENKHLNRKIVEITQEQVALGKQVLILIDTIKHGTHLDESIWEADSNIRHQFINGKEDTKERDKALEKYKAGDLQVLIATSILDEGLDVPNIDVLILGSGGKSKIRLLQRAGRGLRTGDGKDRLLIIDFANFSHKWLLKHSLQRLKTYKDEDCFIIRAQHS